jgi:transcriptional regulator with XRE-family HTH domain
MAQWAAALASKRPCPKNDVRSSPPKQRIRRSPSNSGSQSAGQASRVAVHWTAAAIAGDRQCSAHWQNPAMDTVRFGRQVRALRRRRGWRQIDLAVAARLSLATVSRIELGHAEEVTIAAIDTLAKALSSRIELAMSWNGEGLDRLLDADHATLVDRVARELRALEWEVAVEVSFNIRGERGSIDILAFHPATRVVLVIEVKSVVPDLQATVFTLDRTSRLAQEIARSRGWDARATGRILTVADGRTTRRRVAEHAVVFDAAFPARNVAVRRWLQRPDDARQFSGLWFLANDRRGSARHGVSARRVPSGA